MALISDFPTDNLGAPDVYTVQTACQRIRIREKDRTLATQATFNVYLGRGTTAQPQEAGETFLYDPQRFIMPGEQIRIETINVGAAVLTVFEE